MPQTNLSLIDNFVHYGLTNHLEALLACDIQTWVDFLKIQEPYAVIFLSKRCLMPSVAIRPTQNAASQIGQGRGTVDVPATSCGSR